MVRVKLTLTRGEDSTSDVLVVAEETSFTASHLLEHNGETWRIRAIHTGAGRTLRGTVRAPDIKRMYLHEPPNPEHFTPRTPRERRQAWKEGKLSLQSESERPKEQVKKGASHRKQQTQTEKEASLITDGLSKAKGTLWPRECQWLGFLANDECCTHTIFLRKGMYTRVR